MKPISCTGCPTPAGDGEEHAPLWEIARTMASGIRVPIAVADFVILRAVRDSGGFAIAVGDDKIEAIRDFVCAREGLLLCPEGATTVAAYRNALADGRVAKTDRVVVYNFGTGLKYPMPPTDKVLDRTKPIDYGGAQRLTRQTASAPMDLALQEAQAAAERGEVPVGAVIVDADGTIVASAGNRTIELDDPTAHAEILAIRDACAQMNSQRLTDHDLHVTLEPCAMCAAAISFARIRRLYFAASDEKMGAVENGLRFFNQPTCHHAPEAFGGIGEAAARSLLLQFFKDRR